VLCQYCGTEFNVDVTGRDEYEREATILYHKHGNGAIYRDERVFAATHWLIEGRLLKRWRTGDFEKEKIEARKKAKEQNRHQQRYEKKKEDRYARERAELKERAYSFIRGMGEKEEKEYAPHSFPLAAQLEEIEKPDPFGFIPGSYEKMGVDERAARKVLYATRLMQECERVLWGRVLPETAKASEQLALMIQGFEEERARLLREKEEEEARKAAEREAERQARMQERQLNQSSYDRWR
jgi:hypothetical protein